jgi:asparagine synthase (glutamine-hydrolysing)
MGMAASIEARFPFLESRLAKLAVNMPYESKIRFALGARDRSHYFFRDKWVMRKVAERYVPPELFQQDKKPFPINAYAEERMQIAPAYFSRSFVSDVFELGQHEKAHFLERCPHWLKWKMLLLDVWADVSLNGTPRESVLDKLRRHVSLTNPEYAGFLS